MNGTYTPGCPHCDWVGQPSPDQLVAFNRASDHAALAHQEEHRARPQEGSQLYPSDWDGTSVPDWIDATCAVCAAAIEWDPRNLWSHAG